MTEKPNRATRRQDAAERLEGARDRLRIASRCVHGVAAFGKQSGVEPAGEADYLMAVAAMIVAAISKAEKKPPSVVVEEFVRYVKRLDPTHPDVVGH